MSFDDDTGEKDLVYGRDFTVSQIRFTRGFSKFKAKGRNGRGRPKGAKNKNGYTRRCKQ